MPKQNPAFGAKAGSAGQKNQRSSPGGDSPVLMALGCIALTVSIIASLMLVLQHVAGLSLPGCGPGSPCATLAGGPFGKLPLTKDFGWPVSFLGLAYFGGLMATWIRFRGAASTTFKWIVRIGALASLFFVGVMLYERHFCEYCVAAHAGNLLFWIIVTRASRVGCSATGVCPTGCSLMTTGTAFLIVSAVLGVAEWRASSAAKARDEAALADSIKAIAAKSQAPSTESTQTTIPASTNDGSAAAPPTTSREAQATANPPPEVSPIKGAFTGRYRIGPEKAPVRLVLFSDYQCRDCVRIEGEVKLLIASHPEISYSHKNFPFCKDCNSTLRESMHPNACWAARAAEIAGMLQGEQGFWKMHYWLFEKNGGFENAELMQGLANLGYTPDEQKLFAALMSTQQWLHDNKGVYTDADVTQLLAAVKLDPNLHARFRDILANNKQPELLIQEDIREGMALGLMYTPMVFINGVELKGWNAPAAVTRAVEAVLANNPPPATAEHDRPVPATRKYVEDWVEQPALALPTDPHPWAMGSADAPIRVVMFGDYEEPNTAIADRTIRAIVTGKKDVQYSFRHFPVDQSCNPRLTVNTKHPHACRASLAAEAAAKLGGVDAFWKMHVWLMDHQNDLSDDAIRRGATELGMDPTALFQTMDDPQVRQCVTEDVDAGWQIALPDLPRFYINGKWVPRWRMEGSTFPVLEHVLKEAGMK